MLGRWIVVFCTIALVLSAASAQKKEEVQPPPDTISGEVKLSNWIDLPHVDKSFWDTQRTSPADASSFSPQINPAYERALREKLIAFLPTMQAKYADMESNLQQVATHNIPSVSGADLHQELGVLHCKTQEATEALLTHPETVIDCGLFIWLLTAWLQEKPDILIPLDPEMRAAWLSINIAGFKGSLTPGEPTVFGAMVYFKNYFAYKVKEQQPDFQLRTNAMGMHAIFVGKVGDFTEYDTTLLCDRSDVTQNVYAVFWGSIPDAPEQTAGLACEAFIITLIDTGFEHDLTTALSRYILPLQESYQRLFDIYKKVAPKTALDHDHTWSPDFS